MEASPIVTFQTYQPPGVYVEGTAATLVAPGGIPATTVTIVGEARGYQTATDVLSLTVDPQPLTQKGVLPDTGPAPDLKVTIVDGTVLVEGDDYTLVRGATPGESTTIARVVDSTLVDEGGTVAVSYAYSDSTYYAPKSFADYTSVENVYGPALVSALPADPDDSQVNSPLSLATRFAFENGATTVLCVAVEPATVGYTLLQRFDQAYAKISNNPEVSLLVPVFATSGQSSSAYSDGLQGFISAARVHCESEATMGFGRIAFVGADTVYDDTDTSFEEIAAANISSRVVLSFPNRMTTFNQALNQTTEVGGPYLAAAYAGRLAAQAPNRGLTRLQVFGFNGIPSDLDAEMTLSSKNSMSSSGVCVTEPGRTSQLQVRHGVSTDVSTIVTSEVSITRSQDVLYRQLADGIEDAGLIGDPIGPDTPMAVKGIVGGILESSVTNLVIAEYLDLQVRQQATPQGNPTVIEVRFTYRPFLPLNYITVSFSMDLSTGEVTTEDVVA